MYDHHLEVSRTCKIAKVGKNAFDNCKFGNFRANFIFANSVKTPIFDVEIRDNGVILSKRQSYFSNS